MHSATNSPVPGLLSQRTPLREHLSEPLRPVSPTPVALNLSPILGKFYVYSPWKNLLILDILVATIHFSPFIFSAGFWGFRSRVFLRNENAEFTESLLCSLFTVYIHGRMVH